MIVALAAAVLVLAGPPATPPHDLRFSWEGDGGATVALGALWIGSELEKKRLAPSSCRWCDSVPGVDETARERWKWSAPGRADAISSGIAFAGIPAALLGVDAWMASRDGVPRDFPKDGVMIVEAAVAAAALNQTVKFAVGRERPFVHALPADQKGDTADPADNDLSFYSGHATLAFSLAAASATVAQERGYRDAWVMWPVGMSAAAAVAYLRVAADKHWLTDVATGAVAGTAIGIAAPRLLHPRNDAAAPASMTVLPAKRGTVLQVAFVF